MAREPALVVHGGAAPWESQYHDRARAGCRDATGAGLAILAAGGSALDAVVAAVRVLEERPVFNAGVGAVLNADDGFELDAAVMDGADLRFGGVAAIPNLRNPIELARAVLEDGRHALLCGQGALQFAHARGFAQCDPADLRTERAVRNLRAFRHAQAQGDAAELDPGTVGAVAIDNAGHVAAATSTGGMTGKYPGRIGDTPLPGAGTYADDRGGAASATGEGEAIMRLALTKSIILALARGHNARDAVRVAIGDLAADVKGEGGVICCDRNGRLAAAHNSSEMPFGAGVLRAGESHIVDDIRLPPGTTDLMSLL